MKGPQVATMVWLGNLLVLAGGGFIGFQYYSDIESERDSVYARVSPPKTKEKRLSWQEQSTAGGGFHGLNTGMSPRVRPTDPVTPTNSVPKPEVKVPSDEELKEELEKWLNEEFMLLRIFGRLNATITGKPLQNQSLVVFPGQKFRDAEFANSSNDKIRSLAQFNLEVLSIQMGKDLLDDHVLFRAASRRQGYENRYFEVALKMSEKADAMKVDVHNMGKRQMGSTTVVKEANRGAPGPKTDATPDDEVDSRPTQSTYNVANDVWELGTEDFARPETFEEVARYARVVQDAKGSVIGIQITNDAPENSILIQRGGRRGDIIKAINGHPVKGIADARRIGAEEYDKGVTSFRVDYERDGVPGQKNFKVPPRKQ